jgi:hypothetical protein
MISAKLLEKNYPKVEAYLKQQKEEEKKLRQKQQAEKKRK